MEIQEGRETQLATRWNVAFHVNVLYRLWLGSRFSGSVSFKFYADGLTTLTSIVEPPQYYMDVIDKKITDGITNWVLCNAQLEEGCKDEHIPSFWFFYFVTLLWVLSGVWCIIGFGLKKTLHMRGLQYLR